jgi:ubiquinone/menaquinone biosynthesis C-methylase UbiE
MHPDFDRHSATYGEDVQRSIAFIRQDHEFFVRHKVGHLLRLTRRWVGEPHHLSALDVGCGIGLTDSHLTGVFERVHGVDVSEESLLVAASSNPSVRYEMYDGERLPFSDRAFDVAFAIGVLHHVPVPARGGFVREMARVTGRRGLVVVFEHNPYNPLTRLAVDRCNFDEGVTLASKRSTTRLFAGCGLDLVEDAYVLFFPWAFAGSASVERWLRWFPLGAQHIVAGRHP